MGTLHPRTKRPPSLRLAQATYSTVYAPATPLLASGPVLRDCAIAGSTLTVRFNATLLKGERVVISVPDLADPPSLALENTAFYALVNATLPSDLDHNHRIPGINYQGPFAGGNEFGVTGWVALLPVASASDPTAVTLDLAPLQGLTPTAIRYAVGGGGCWDGDPRVNGLCTRLCTGPHRDCTTQPCYPASCPIKSSASVAGGEELPAAPFVANIVNGKCQCLAPQVCG